MEAYEYVLRQSLKQMTIGKIAIYLWNRFCYESINSISPREQGVEILVKKVNEKVPLLPLPTSLSENLMKEILFIVIEIKRWRDYHRSLISSKVAKHELHQLCWTSQGTVDYRKTAERLIRLERVDAISGYKLSCLCCFEEDIRKFWGKLPETYKKRYYSENIVYDMSLHRSRAKLVTFWTYFLKEDTNSMINQYEDGRHRTFDQHAFESAALSGNKVATEYFLLKLSFEEKEASLVETAECVIEKRCFYSLSVPSLPQDFPVHNLWTVVSYLLSRMSKEEQTELFKKRPFATLVCFLDCPWLVQYMKVARLVWPFISFREFRGLLTILSASRAIPVFREIFLLSSSHYRNKLFRNHSVNGDMPENFSSFFPRVYPSIPLWNMKWFEYLFWFNYPECIKLVLRNVNSEEKERLIISEYGVELCRLLVTSKKWFLLELFMEECAVSIKSKRSLKDCLMLCFNSCEEWEVIRDKVRLRNNFFHLIDKLDVSVCNKRCIKELGSDLSTSSKKKHELKCKK